MLDSSPPSSATPRARVVFLHGAGLGTWIWEPVRRGLAAESVALDVPSRPGTSPALCALDLLSHPEFPRDVPVVLVLHSLAGVLEAALVSALGDRVRQVIHVATVVPERGRSFASARGFPVNLVLRALFALRPRGLKPSPEMLLRELGTDLSEPLRAELVARHRCEYPGLFLEPVPDLDVHPRRTYLRCGRDQSVSPALQTRIANRLGAVLVDLDCGHLPMLSDPAGFCRILSPLLEAETPGRVLSRSTPVEA